MKYYTEETISEMSREIKFRGRTVNGEWIYGSPYPDQVYRQGSFGVDIWLIREEGEDHEVRENSIGQWTGLEDKDGKDIYEGDIYKYINHRGKIEKGKIEFKIGSFVCKYKTPYPLGSMNDEIVIIGNIHETPNLLKP